MTNPFAAFVGAVGLMFAPSAKALDAEELQALKAEVLQMCRGGTLTGSKIRSQRISGGRMVTFGDLLKSPEQTFVSETQWRGIEAIAGNHADYAACAERLVSVLAPAIQFKRNADTNLNARLEYLQSAAFCDRLIYVISRAPTNFAEWRSVSGRGQAIGRYLMADVASLQMTSNAASSVDVARIEVGTNGEVNFYEPLVYTHRFSAGQDAGFILKRVEKAIDACLTPRAFRSTPNVRYRGGPYKTNRGSTYWSFDETGTLGFAKRDFDVWLRMLSAEELNLPTNQIYIHIDAP